MNIHEFLNGFLNRIQAITGPDLDSNLVSDLINEFFDEAISDINQCTLAEDADFHPSSLSKFLRGRQKLKQDNLISLARAVAERCQGHPQIILVILARLYNLAHEAYRIEIRDHFASNIYSGTDIKEILNEMLHSESGRKVNYLYCIESMNSLKTWVSKYELNYDLSLYCILEPEFKSKLNSEFMGRLNSDYLMASTNFSLYELLRDLFILIRNPLQLIGSVQLRISLAKWLEGEAIRRGDLATQIIATSSLAWSYTSSTGGFQNLDQAEELASSAFKLYRESDQRRVIIPPDIITEIHENMARISTRKERFNEANSYIQIGYSVVEELKSSVEPRHHLRFHTTFRYHSGLRKYHQALKGCQNSMQLYEKAIADFKIVADNANTMGWKRVEEAAESWKSSILLQIAVESEQYEHILNIIKQLMDMSDDECNIFADTNPACRVKRKIKDFRVAAEAISKFDQREASLLKGKAKIMQTKLDLLCQSLFLPNLSFS